MIIAVLFLALLKTQTFKWTCPRAHSFICPNLWVEPSFFTMTPPSIIHYFLVGFGNWYEGGIKEQPKGTYVSVLCSRWTEKDSESSFMTTLKWLMMSSWIGFLNTSTGSQQMILILKNGSGDSVFFSKVVFFPASSSTFTNFGKHLLTLITIVDICYHMLLFDTGCLKHTWIG